VDEFILSLSSTSWWISVVLVGIVIHITSSYIKPLLDRMASAVSRSWAERSKARRAEREKLVADLRSDLHLQLLFLAAEARHRSRAIALLLFTVLFLMGFTAIGSADLILALGGIHVTNSWHRYVFAAAGVLTFFFCLRERGTAEYYRSLVVDVRYEGTTD
jgi:hypothetical protein